MKEYIDPENWQRLTQRWEEIRSTGHTLELRYRRIVAPDDENRTQVIDIIQNIDGDLFIETVECSTGEVEAVLEINHLSLEGLQKEYEVLLKNLLLKQPDHHDTHLVVTMIPTSPSTGEISCYLERPTGRSNVQLNYRHYYMLKALREKMSSIVGESCSRVQAIYQSGMFGNLEFYFDYESSAKEP